MLKMLRTKKEKGTIDHLLPGFLIVIIAFIIFLVYIDTASVIALRDRADMITREYVLKMESNGWLDDASTQNLVSKLENLESGGIYVENIRVSGSVSQYDAGVVLSGVSEPVGYANTVTLEITGDIINPKANRSAFGIPITSSNYDLHIVKQSTAKY